MKFNLPHMSSIPNVSNSILIAKHEMQNLSPIHLNKILNGINNKNWSVLNRYHLVARGMSNGYNFWLHSGKGRRLWLFMRRRKSTWDGIEIFNPKMVVESYTISITLSKHMGFENNLFDRNDIFLLSYLIKIMSYYCLIR